MKLWAGRSDGNTDRRTDDFNSSIRFDSRMYAEDIRGSMAHAAMLGLRGIIPGTDADAIIAGLEGILSDMQSGALTPDPAAEDIHMFIESELTRRIGDAGKRLHTARSRNDQVATDTRLYAKKEISALRGEIAALMRVLLGLAKSHTGAVMPGYTHMQRAQPVTLAHHLCAWCEMLRRDIGRLGDAYRRMDECPLGGGALAGTTYPVDRAMTAASLGFERVSPNSMDAVSDRDFAIETAAAVAILMTHLSRMSEEIILWCSAEFGFASLSDAFSTGSSIMPQKKNPDVAELVRGKTGRAYGSLIALLTVMKGLPLAYNKDMQEDKEALFDAFDTAHMCLVTFAPMVGSMTFNTGRMRIAVGGGYLNATDCADFLVLKGMPFREAYGVSGRLVALCQGRGIPLEELPLEDFRAASELFDGGIYEALRPETCVARRNVPGGPAPDAVRAHISELERFLEGVGNPV